jgi:predicted dehydrogenase
MIKVAFIGCGSIMAEHYKHLSGFAEVKIVGHCDSDLKKAQKAAAQWGGDSFGDCAVMFDKVKPHAVYICVPPHAHGPMEEAAAVRGIHLFIEGPIALDRKSARHMAQVIRQSRVLTSVGYCCRYFDTVAQARKILKGKAISLVSGTWKEPLPAASWRRHKGKSGGQLIERTTHLFDLMRYLCGEVAEVHAVASQGCMTHVRDYDIYDSSVVAMRLKNGATASITSTCIMNHETLPEDDTPLVCANHHGWSGMEIITPELVLHIDTGFSLAGRGGGALRIEETGRTTEYSSPVNVYKDESQAFVDAVQMGKRGRIKSTYSDAVKTFLIAHAAQESILSGMPVKP